MHGLFIDQIRTNPEAQQRVRDWIKALRSGNYQQGESALHLKGDGYCCLGVACDLFDNTRWAPGDVPRQRLGLLRVRGGTEASPSHLRVQA